MIAIEKYKRDGVLYPVGQMDVSGFAEKYTKFQQDSLKIRGKETYLKPHLVSPWLDQIVRDQKIIDVVEQILGPDIILWESDWSVKRSGTGDYVPWHQDSPYWNLSTDEVVSVLLALTDMTIENGAMKIIVGSHRQGQIGKLSVDGDVHDSYSQGKRTTDENCMFPYSHEFSNVDLDSAESMVMNAGDFSVHDVNLVHGGGPNRADYDRIAFGMRYISANTRCLSGVDSVTAIKGHCDRDYFQLEPRADGDFTNAGLVRLERALEYPSGFGESKRLR